MNTGGNSAEPYGWTAKTANIGAPMPDFTFIFIPEDKIQESTDYLL